MNTVLNNRKKCHIPSADGYPVDWDGVRSISNDSGNPRHRHLTSRAYGYEDDVNFNRLRLAHNTERVVDRG